MKLCISCIHFQSIGIIKGQKVSRCMHDACSQISPVYGTKYSLIECEEAREKGGICGEDAILFEKKPEYKVSPKAKEVRLFSRIANFFN